MAKARQTVLFFCLVINLPGTSGLPCPALAQSTPPGGQIQDRFKQLDRNGNGTLTEDEIGPEWLKKLDRNGDGVVTLDEAQALFSGQRRPLPAKPPEAPAAAPSKPEPARGFKPISHWVPGTKWISYVRTVGGSASPQLVYLDTETGAVHQVSDESGDKFDAWGFRAPEFGGEVLMMCVIDRRQIAVYRDVAKNGKPWTRIATLALPADAPHTHIYSVEPIAPETGVNGTSWFSLNAMAGGTGRNLGATGRTAKDGSIWVLGLGTDEVFIYYERKSPETGRGEIRRCRTGISVSGNSPAAPKPQLTEKP